MFVFNLNFNTTAGLPVCDQMRYYGVEGRPAESALSSMPKATGPPTGELVVGHLSVATMITAAQQPFSRTTAISLGNIGAQSFAYTITVNAGSLNPEVSDTTGTLSPNMWNSALITIISTGRPTGSYSASLDISAAYGALGVPVTIPITLFVVDEIHDNYLSFIRR